MKNSALLCVFFAYFVVNDFYRRDHKEGTETTETKYYFECFLDLSRLIQPLAIFNKSIS
jgi:hypothetical protein